MLGASRRVTHKERTKEAECKRRGDWPGQTERDREQCMHRGRPSFDDARLQEEGEEQKKEDPGQPQGEKRKEEKRGEEKKAFSGAKKNKQVSEKHGPQRNTRAKKQ